MLELVEQYLLATLLATRRGYDLRGLFRFAFDSEGLLILAASI